MSTIATIKQALLTARKARDERKVVSLSTLMASIQVIGKNDGNRETTDDEAIKYMKKLLNTLNDNVDIYTKSGKDVAKAEALFEIELVSAFLPAEASESQILETIQEVITERNLPKAPASIGIIMGALKSKFGNSLNEKAAGVLARNAISS